MAKEIESATFNFSAAFLGRRYTGVFKQFVSGFLTRFSHWQGAADTADYNGKALDGVRCISAFSVIFLRHGNLNLFFFFACAAFCHSLTSNCAAQARKGRHFDMESVVVS